MNRVSKPRKIFEFGIIVVLAAAIAVALAASTNTQNVVGWYAMAPSFVLSWWWTKRNL